MYLRIFCASIKNIVVLYYVNSQEIKTSGGKNYALIGWKIYDWQDIDNHFDCDVNFKCDVFRTVELRCR